MKIIPEAGLCIGAFLTGVCAAQPVVPSYRLQDAAIDMLTCVPFTRVIPKYPKKALKKGIEGYAIVEFTLDHQGLPKNARVVGAQPPDIFDKAALSAIKKNKYLPCIVNKKPVNTQGALEKIVFDLKEGAHYLGGDFLPFITDEPPTRGNPKLPDREIEPLVRIAPAYPKGAFNAGIQGWVQVQYTITKTGTVRDAIVVDSNPPGIFDLATLEAVAKFRYKPKIADGQPMDVQGVRTVLRFEIE